MGGIIGGKNELINIRVGMPRRDKGRKENINKRDAMRVKVVTPDMLGRGWRKTAPIYLNTRLSKRLLCLHRALL